VCITLFLVMALLSLGLWFQYVNYDKGVTTALHASETPHVVVLAYSRSWDVAVNKTASMFLGFVLIFIGALYVLRSADTHFALTVEGKSKGSLETSSPGLVMITLAVVLIGLSLSSKSVVDLTSTDLIGPGKPAQPPPAPESGKDGAVAPTSSKTGMKNDTKKFSQPVVTASGRVSTLHSVTSSGPYPVEFDKKRLGTVSALTVTLKNAGQKALSISAVSVPEPYPGTGPTEFVVSAKVCGTSLAPSATCNLTIQFKPMTIGEKRAWINLPDGVDPRFLLLTGTGT
jgi:hypothetical protein